MTAEGAQSENYEWLPYLTKIAPVQTVGSVDRIGRDPKLISPEILSAAGHPPRSATSRIKVYMNDMDFQFDPERDRGLKRLRELCLSCGYSTKAVRDCSVIDCPLWVHRLGTNPHTFHKRQARRSA